MDSDKTSELPDFIIHMVLSYLPRKDATRTSILSKKWLQAWVSFPILKFNQLKFSCQGQSRTPEASSDKFLKVVDCSMKRFVEQKLRMKKFKIVIDVLESESSVASQLVEKWFRLAADNLVEKLHLRFYQLVNKLQYVFNQPNCNLLQRIFGATTTFSSNNCLEDAPPKLKNQFTNLRKLSISGAHLNEQLMLYIIASCPYIQEFVLIRSQGINFFEISGLDYLEKLEVDGLNFEKVDVDAPKLTELDLHGGYYFNFFKWSKFLSNSVRLRRLILRMTVHFEVIDDCLEGEGTLGETSVPGQWVLEDLDLHVESPYSSYTALSNNILWSCMSKTTRVWKSPKTETSFMRHIYRKLMRRDDYKCSFNHNAACWRHYLKDVVEIIRCDDNICFKLNWDRSEMRLLKLNM